MAKARAGWAIGLAILLAAGAVFYGLGRPARSITPNETAVVQMGQEPDSLNPYLSPMSATSTLSTLFYSGLVSLDDHGEYFADLAERVPTLENGDVTLAKGGMRVTYHLRDARWQDGLPVTSEDVVATWKLVMSPTFPAISTAGYDQIADVLTPDAHTVTVVYKRPYAPYLELFPYVLPAHLIDAAHEDGRSAWNRSPVGSGPYRLERWISGDRLVALANADYVHGAPGVPRLEIRFIPNENTAMQLWRAGAIDLLQSAPPTQYDLFQREAPSLVHLTPSTAWEHLAFNLKNPILADVRVRRAIAHLVDRQELISKAYGGVSVPAWSEVPTISWAYNSEVEHRYAPDAEQAAALLEAAGWKRGADGMRAKNGHPLALTLTTTSEKPSRALAAQIWRRQWREAGIALRIEKLPASLIFGSGGRLGAGDFELALVSSLSRPDPDSSFRWRSDQVPPNGQNRSRWANPEVDALLAAGQTTVSRDRRKAIYHKLADRLITDLPVLPLLYWVDIDATSPRLQGFRPNPTLRGNLWNVWQWKLKQPS